MIGTRALLDKADHAVDSSLVPGSVLLWSVSGHLRHWYTLPASIINIEGKQAH